MFDFSAYIQNEWSWTVLSLMAIFVGMSKTGIQGLAILTVPLLAMTFGAKPSTGLMLPVLCFADVIGVSYYRRQAEWRYIVRLPYLHDHSNHYQYHSDVTCIDDVICTLSNKQNMIDMKKIIIIDGGPRKTFNTASMLQKIAEGAASVSDQIEVKTIRLYDMQYRGCMSCMACKLKDRVSNVCKYKDALTPVLEEIAQAVGAVLVGIFVFREPATFWRLFFLTTLIASIVGLKTIS